MARTFIGELILRLRDDASGKAKQTAREVTSALTGIEQAAKRLNTMPWGGGFQRQLEKLGASAHDIDQLRGSWDRLYQSMTNRNLSRALRSSELANWRQATLGHFAAQQAAIRAELDKTEKHYKTWRTNMQAITRAGLVAVGGYTGAYVSGMMGREAFIASSEWQREQFRQRMANISPADRATINANAERLGGKYQSVSITDIAEMGRSATAMMGTVDRAMQILPDLVRGMVTLQSTKGTDVATDELRGLLRGIDNAGQNGGDLGIENTRAIIAGMIRAAQIEGADIDVGKLFQFARRGKIAVPGLSTDFLATSAPAFMQDMTPEGFGTALSSAYQAFVIGSSAVASKVNLASQRELGIRDDNGLIGASTFGKDPYQWVNEVLVPALEKSGVDMSDETAVAQRMAQLSRNTNATALLTRMVTQRPQVDRLRQQYGNAMGPEAAEAAANEDPFVAYRGFLESLRNLAAAVGEDVMPGIVSGLNSLAGGINSLQQAWRDGDPLTKMGLTAGAGVAGYGTFKAISGLWALATAGPALNVAAANLNAAALALGGGGIAGKAAGAVGAAGAAATASRWGWLGSGWAMLRSGLGGFGASQSLGIGSVQPLDDRMKDMLYGQVFRRQFDSNFANARKGGLDPFGQDRKIGLPGDAIANHEEAVRQAEEAGSKIQEALSPTATPNVDTSMIDGALAKARELLGILSQVGRVTSGIAVPGAGNLSREMNRNLSDQGVAP